MNMIQKLQDYLRSSYPSAKIELIAPLLETGFWSLDFDFESTALSVQWRPSHGFDLSAVRPDSYGEGADEHLDTLNAVTIRIGQLTLENESVSPPINIILSRVREQRSITQQQLADKLGLKQASISGIERREDIQLSTLRKYVSGLGGSVEIFVLFSEGRYRLTSSAIREMASDSTASETKRRSINVRSRPPLPSKFNKLSTNGGLPAAERMASFIKENKSVFQF